jgi:hypothetical protein
VRGPDRQASVIAATTIVSPENTTSTEPSRRLRHPAGKAPSRRFLLHPRTIANALDASGDNDVNSLDHGFASTGRLGERVRIYQAVTLGARHFPADESGTLVKGAPHHPIVEDDVVIYAGATILGCITIGRGSTIGDNVWLTHSAAPGSQISQAQARNNGKLE